MMSEYAALRSPSPKQLGDPPGKKQARDVESWNIKISYPCSIALYVCNLMRKVVPETIAQEISSGNPGIRRLTPDRMKVYAFGLYAGAERSRAVSSLQVKRSGIFDQGSVYPAGVMY